MTRSFCLVGVLLALTGCRAPAAPPDLSKVDTELQAVYDRFSEAYLQADAEAFADIYTEDALYLQPGTGIQRGHDAVLPNFRDFLGRFEPGKGPRITFEIVDRDVSGDLAYDIGYYNFNGGEPEGKFIVIWKRGTDGQWRMHADGYSGLRP